jgi:hypothetical protein
LNPARLGGRLHHSQAQPIERLPAVALVILITRQISVIHPNELTLALNREGNLIVRHRHYPALRVEYLDRAVRDVPAVGRDGGAVDGECDRSRRSGGDDFPGVPTSRPVRLAAILSQPMVTGRVGSSR